jgi:hypothetical protein
MAIDSEVQCLPDRLDILLPAPQLVTQFSDEYRRILLDSAVAQAGRDRTREARHQIAISDIDAILSHLKRLASDQEYDSSIEVAGHGGTLRIHMQKKNLLRLHYDICKEIMKLIGILSAVGGLICVLIVAGLGGLLAVGAMYLGIPLLCVVGAIIKKLASLRTEVKEYERKRTAGTTAS